MTESGRERERERERERVREREREREREVCQVKHSEIKGLFAYRLV